MELILSNYKVIFLEEKTPVVLNKMRKQNALVKLVEKLWQNSSSNTKKPLKKSQEMQAINWSPQNAINNL